MGSLTRRDADGGGDADGDSKDSFVISLCQALHETLHKLFHLINEPTGWSSYRHFTSQENELFRNVGASLRPRRRRGRWEEVAEAWPPPSFCTIAGRSARPAFPRTHRHLQLPRIRTLHLHFFTIFLHFLFQNLFRGCPRF